MSAERGGQTELKPEKELFAEGGYRWFVYSESQTGLRLVCLEDLGTGIIISTPLANPNVRVAAHKAWGGARQSRAPGDPWDIYYEMGVKGVDPDVKVEEMFRGYGHASVGDMARVQVEFTRVPMHTPLTLFNLSAINSGQEKSTRYQSRFGIRSLLHGIYNYLPEGLPGIEQLASTYQEFGELSLRLFAKHRELLTHAFKEFYRPEPAQEGSLNSRVLDCARYFLLLGQSSGFSFETSARDWSRIISDLKASPLPLYRKIGAQIEKLLAPTGEEEDYLGYKAEAPGLIRHTEPNSLVNQNLGFLKEFLEQRTDLFDLVEINPVEFRGSVKQSARLVHKLYSEGERMVAQYITALYPGIHEFELLSWAHGQPKEIKEEISSIILGGHNNYKELPHLARVSGMTLILRTFLGELRDFNRHRSLGRFIALPTVFGPSMDKDTTLQIIYQGFGLPLYLTKVPQFKNLKNEFEGDMHSYYQKLIRFVEHITERYSYVRDGSLDYSFILNLLPLAHQVDIWMHGDPKQLLYMTHQRTRPGGHINYRTLAFRANQLIADSDPYLSGMRLKKQPDPKSREEFFDRS